jgi:hypothetical protein
MKEFEDNLEKDEHTALGALSGFSAFFFLLRKSFYLFVSHTDSFQQPISKPTCMLPVF